MSATVAWTINLVVVAGSAFCLILFGSQLDEARDELDRTRDDLAAIREWIADNFGGPEPMVATEPMPKVHIADARTAVAAAREANSPKPVPFPREGKARHRA